MTYKELLTQVLLEGGISQELVDTAIKFATQMSTPEENQAANEQLTEAEIAVHYLNLKETSKATIEKFSNRPMGSAYWKN